MRPRAQLFLAFACALAAVGTSCLDFPDYEAYCVNHTGPDCPPRVQDSGQPDTDAGTQTDGGEADAGEADAGAADAGHVDAGAEDAGTSDAGTQDAGGPDSGTPDAGPRGDGGWGPPSDAWFIHLNEPTSNELTPTMTADQLKICFASDRGQSTFSFDLYCATRTSVDVPFDAPEPQADINNWNGTFNEINPELSPDGQQLFYAGGQQGQLGEFIMRSGPPTATGYPLGTRIPLDYGGSQAWEGAPSLLWDAGVMYLHVIEPNSVLRIFSARFEADGGFHTLQLESALNVTGKRSADPAVSPDGTFLTFCSDRDTSDGGLGLYRAERSASGAIGTISPIPITSAGVACGPFVTSSGDLLFHELANGQYDLKRAPALP